MNFIFKGKTYVDIILLIACIQFTFGGEPGFSLHADVLNDGISRQSVHEVVILSANKRVTAGFFFAFNLLVHTLSLEVPEW